MVYQIELKYKYKYRLILDEGISFGTVGQTGRGLTEFHNVSVRISFAVAAELLLTIFARLRMSTSL
jgi:7-keto-8-aminopelargonate synthetase-like enzyme